MFPHPNPPHRLELAGCGLHNRSDPLELPGADYLAPSDVDTPASAAAAAAAAAALAVLKPSGLSTSMVEVGDAATNMTEAITPTHSLPRNCSTAPGEGGRSTLEDPNFVTNFLARSRLHFLGSFCDAFETRELPVLMAGEPRFRDADYAGTQPSALLGFLGPSRSASADFFSPRPSSRPAQNKAQSPNKQCSPLTPHPEPFGPPHTSLAAPPLPPALELVLHVDIDCFFAAAAALDNPALRDRPVAVCHQGDGASSGAGGNGGISSCNYLARAKGVKAEMRIREAKQICPDLELISFEFDKYSALSRQMYQVFFALTHRVWAKSVDEAYLLLPASVAHRALDVAQVCNYTR